jgi:hypothetical protein
MNADIQENLDEGLDGVCELMRMAFDSGQQWMKSIAPSDWRSRRYKSKPPRKFQHKAGEAFNPKDGQPPIKLIVLGKTILDAIKFGEGGNADEWNFLVRPDPLSEKHGQKWVCIVRIVPHLNIDNVRHVNFNAWFHGIDGVDMSTDQLIGWRFEGSEGNVTSHNLYHMQPLRGFKRGEEFEGCVRWMPESFPTVAVAAKNQIQLAFVVLLMLGGKEGLRKIIQDAKSESLRTGAREFWGSVFGGEALTS